MKNSLKLEEFCLFSLSIFLFCQLNISWWWFIVCFFVPDISMLGYVLGNRVGAMLYNFFHHKGIAILFYLTGCFLENEILQFTGALLLSHSSFDRIFGYGLKYNQGFKFTHLGEIGKEKNG